MQGQFTESFKVNITKPLKSTNFGTEPANENIFKGAFFHEKHYFCVFFLSTWPKQRMLRTSADSMTAFSEISLGFVSTFSLYPRSQIRKKKKKTRDLGPPFYRTTTHYSRWKREKKGLGLQANTDFLNWSWKRLKYRGNFLKISCNPVNFWQCVFLWLFLPGAFFVSGIRPISSCIPNSFFSVILRIPRKLANNTHFTRGPFSCFRYKIIQAIWLWHTVLFDLDIFNY